MMTNDEVVLNLNKQKTFNASMCFGLPHPSQSFLLFHYLATEAEGQNSSWFKKGEINVTDSEAHITHYVF